MKTQPALTLYLRYGCSLCDEMLAALRPLQQELGFYLDIVEVEEEPALEQRYGTRVPVLTSPQGELCQYFLDEERVRRYFAAL
ncbi:glutaredoxin family protein [Sulfurivermis fontis]|uniref:glutaredoxin family protein n=1 Tax=Sulfurivermis fontis TaxID=1972068 RepID=UPI000FDCAD1A|nr:glutaredoxin family protein [Sulfurivermis fontis]